MCSTVRNCFLLAFGSNAADDSSANATLLRQAVAKINSHGIEVAELGPIYRTPAFPAGSGPDFANACAVAKSDLSPEAVLGVLHAVESAMGRVRTVRWGQRVIDIDLLAAGDTVFPDRDGLLHWMNLDPTAQARVAPDRLILPHPRLHQRAFVLVPLADVAPGWVHPVLGQSVRQMLAALDPAETALIRPI